MSSTQSYSRFSDENYKNWLKTTESLYILRSHIQGFIEKETETYHNSLRNKPQLNRQPCALKCKDANKLCQPCENWKKEIAANHNGNNNNMHWTNCLPHLWPTDKWEVAKAHMPRGQTKHQKFDQFDIAAILNLMNFCKHFKKIRGQFLKDVITVRNNVMHSPDFKVSNEDMKKHQKTLLKLAKELEPHVPEMKDLEKEITKFYKILDKNFNQAPCEVDGQREDVQTVKDRQNVLDREQQAMKDRIEDFIARFEGNQDENVNEKPQDMKSFLDFLDQNKDLLETLGPEVSKLKEMQARVDQHEEQISNLTGRVDQLEQGTPYPVLLGKPPKYKNHLYEYCQAKKWPDDKYPIFTEDQEAQGYRGKVTVNGQSFIGRGVCNDKKAAHQEVAFIALEQLKSQEESTDEVTQPEASSSSSSGMTFFGKVTVDLSREVASHRCSSKEEATEAAYKVLWGCFCISAPIKGQTYKSVTVEYFSTNGFPKPIEDFDDSTTICKLKLIGPFTFCDKDGSTKKKQAEQQAAKVALQHLSGILSCPAISDTEKNFKGVLKELLDQLSIKNPVYDTVDKAEVGKEPTAICISSDTVTSTVSIREEEVKDHSEPAQLPSGQGSVHVPVPVQPDSSSPASLRKKPRIDCPGSTFIGKVTLDLSREVASDRCCSKEEATEAAYKALWESFRISAPAEGQTYRTGIVEYFNTHGLQKPTEEFVDDENTTVCKLKLIGPFTFCDKDGSTKKRQAEQQAAKVALQQLSWILSCSPISDTEKNFKGVLKEHLDQLGIKNPVYDTEEYKAETSEEPVTSGMSPNLSNLSISQTAVKEHSESESTSTPAQLPSGQESVHVLVPVQPDRPDSSSPASRRKKPRLDCPSKDDALLQGTPVGDASEINDLLNVYNLKPPHVNMENMKYDQNFKCTVTVNLENYTYANKLQGYDTKKDAIRKSYLLFGCAMAILDPNTDEKMSSALVKQHFTQRSLPLPQEDVEGSAKLFYCSLKNITYDVKYDGQGSSEDKAKLNALQKALSSLSPLFGYPAPLGADRAEEVQNQLSSMLNGARQKEPVIDLKSEEQASIQLSFCDYTLKCTCQSKKKAARNHLSKRILGLLGVKTENSASLRNSLNEWFGKKNLPQPVFEDTEEALGAKATFSVQLNCCSPGWEDSWETAKSKLLQELKLRFQFLDDKNN